MILQLTYISGIHIIGITNLQHRPLYHIQVSSIEEELNASSVRV